MTTTALFFTARYAQQRSAGPYWDQTCRLISCIGQSLAAMKSDVLTVLFILCWWLVLGSGERAAGNRTQASSVGKLDQFEGAHYRRISLEVTTATGPQAADVYLPDQQMVAAELWDFESWYKRDMTSFLEREFNLDGVRPPVR